MPTVGWASSSRQWDRRAHWTSSFGFGDARERWRGLLRAASAGGDDIGKVLGLLLVALSAAAGAEIVEHRGRGGLARRGSRPRGGGGGARPLVVGDFEGVGVVAVGGVVAAPAPPVPGEDTLITCAGAVAALPDGDPERPISTPIPIESSSTPTPAITAVGPPERAEDIGGPALAAASGCAGLSPRAAAAETPRGGTAPGERPPAGTVPDENAASVDMDVDAFEPLARRRSSRPLPSWERQWPHSRQ